jgi:hypothetical protein
MSFFKFIVGAITVIETLSRGGGYGINATFNNISVISWPETLKKMNFDDYQRSFI